MSEHDDPFLGEDSSDWDLPLFGLATLVYAERDGQILLMKRSGGVASGQWYIPGGVLDHGETPVEGAIRELYEESGLRPTTKLSLVGAYPVFQYGRPFLHVSYRCEVDDGDVVVSHEHDGARWVDPDEMRAGLSDEVIATLAGDNSVIASLLQGVRDDLDRYLALRHLPLEPL
jgi:8-oxo-dGTP diphosphatase